MKIFITGAAGFIGLHVAERLLDAGHAVVGLDGFTPYYDVALKEARHARLAKRNRYAGHRFMLEDAEALSELVAEEKPEIVIHLAAQAGVRYSLENPRAYVDSNLVGTFNLMEAVRKVGAAGSPVKHFLIASTSSVYGANPTMPFRESDRADWPMTLYAASKKATEGMAHSYAHLWGIPTTAFRFFSVYGPWGRPDMAFFKFTRGIVEGTPIDLYNHGEMARDFTYVDDLAEGIVRLVGCVPGDAPAVEGDSLSPAAPFRAVNIGRGKPERLLDFLAALEKAVGRQAIRNNLPKQPGDPDTTWADASLLAELTGYTPTTAIGDGTRKFVDWYRAYHAA